MYVQYRGGKGGAQYREGYHEDTMGDIFSTVGVFGTMGVS